MSPSGGHAPYGQRLIVQSTVSSAAVYASLAESILTGIYALLALIDQRSRLSADIVRES